MEFCSVLPLVTFSLLAGAPDLAPVPGRDAIPREALRDELIKMSSAGMPAPSEKVMALRKKQDEIDKKNLARPEEIVRRHGWPGRSLVEEEASVAAFLLLKKAAAEGEARRADAAPCWRTGYW